MKFKLGDFVRNNLTYDSPWVRAGDTGIVLEYEEDCEDSYGCMVSVRWDNPVDTSNNRTWWAMEDELEHHVSLGTNTDGKA